MKNIMNTLIAISAVGLANAQTTYPPLYTANSITDQKLRYNAGVDNIAEADLPTFQVGMVTDTTPKVISSGGSTLTTSGSLLNGVATLPGEQTLGTVQSTIETGLNSLTFGTKTTDLASLAGASVPLTWNSKTLIDGSDTWTTLPDIKYCYKFDLSTADGLIGLPSTDIPTLGLKITDGLGNELFRTDTVQELIGSDPLTADMQNLKAEFDYDPNNGPLNIEWSAERLADTAFLTAVEGDTKGVYTIGEPVIVHCPEPSSTLLIGLGAFGLILRRRV